MVLLFYMNNENTKFSFERKNYMPLIQGYYRFFSILNYVQITKISFKSKQSKLSIKWYLCIFTLVMSLFLYFIKGIIVFYQNKIILDFKMLIAHALYAPTRERHSHILGGACGASPQINLTISRVVRYIVASSFSWCGACHQQVGGLSSANISFLIFFSLLSPTNC